MSNAISVVSLDREFRRADRAYDLASVGGDAVEANRCYSLLLVASDALFHATPHTLVDAVIVLRDISSGIRAADDPLGYPLLARIRFLTRRFSRGFLNAADLSELRAIGKICESIRDGDGRVPQIAGQLAKVVACFSRPALVA